MGADKIVINHLPEYLKRLKYRWMADVRITEGDGELHYELLGLAGWHRVAPEILPESSPLSQVVLLLADCKCSFRCLEFPIDMVAAKDLDEAIALDVAMWNPFASDTSLLSFSERVEEHWKVAVWVWSKDEENRLLQKLSKTVHCTHIMPAMAWYVARVQEKSHVLLVHARGAAREECTYAMVSPAGVPRVLSRIGNKSEAQRFWRGLGDNTQLVRQAFSCDAKQSDWLADVVDMKEMEPTSARLALLNRARLKGVKDWTDPLRWRKPMLAFLSLLIVWMLADVATLTHRTDAVSEMLGKAERQASDVLNYRDQVDAMQLRLQGYSHLRALQRQPERLLAALSENIPSDIWLNTLQSGQGWVDIHGQGKNVVRLVVLLEKIDAVKKVMILSDIRADARTGLEAFHLRLILKNGLPQGGKS